MEEIRDMWGEPAGKDLYFIASMTDYYYLETLTSTAVTHVYQDGIKLKVLGRNIRTFKPGIPFHIQVCVHCFSVSCVRVCWKVHFELESPHSRSHWPVLQHLRPCTLTYVLDLHSWHRYYQEEPACQIYRPIYRYLVQFSSKIVIQKYRRHWTDCCT